MAEEYQRVVDLPVKTSSGISLLSDYLMGIDSNDGYQMLLNDLAKKIVEDYVGSSLGGSSRTLKSALDAISNQIGSTTMGTTATTVTGAIKEHNDKIGSVAMGTTATTLTGAIKEHNDKIGNSTMGTTATTLTGAIAEHESDISTLNSKTTWNYLDKKTGTGNAISYSSITFSELLVIVNIGNSGNKESFYIPKAELTETNWWRAGGYTTLQTPALVTISTGTSSVQLTNASQGTTDYSSTSTISVYYR